MPTWLCRACQFFSHTSVAASILSQVAMAVTRFHVLGRERRLSATASSRAVFLIWAFSAVYGLRAPLIYTIFHRQIRNSHFLLIECSVPRDGPLYEVFKIILKVDFFLLCLAPCAIITSCYLYIVRKWMNNGHDGHSSASSRIPTTPEGIHSCRTEGCEAADVVVHLFVRFLCDLPAAAAYIGTAGSRVWYGCGRPCRTHRQGKSRCETPTSPIQKVGNPQIVTVWLFSNAILNPVAVLLLRPRLRRDVSHFLCRCFPTKTVIVSPTPSDHSIRPFVSHFLCRCFPTKTVIVSPTPSDHSIRPFVSHFLCRCFPTKTVIVSPTPSDHSIRPFSLSPELER